MTNRSITHTTYIVFASSHIRVENYLETEIHSDITDIFGALVRSEPIGTEIGRLELHRRRENILVVDATGPSNEFVTARDAINGFFHRVVQAIIAAHPELLWLHAGVASTKDRAIVFLGPSRSGKSTLVTGLIQVGWHYLSDEVAPIDPETSTVMPFPITPLVRKPNREAIQQSRFGEFKKDSFALDSVVVAEHANAIGAFVFPTYRSDSMATINQASPAGAAVAMLNNSLNINPYTAEHVGQFCGLAGQTPCFNLQYAQAADAVALLCTERLWEATAYMSFPNQIHR